MLNYALTTHGYKNHSIRTEQFRYIQYEDGSEELYDHSADPEEWVNLAGDPKHEKTKKTLAAMIPAKQHPGLKVKDWFDKYQE